MSAASRHVTLRIATYNIHRSRGLDRRTDPSRIADVIASLEADIIALQEVIGPGSEGKALVTFEAFKVYGGMIHAAEAVFKSAPLNASSGWD